MGDDGYDLKDVNLPTLAGTALRVAATLVETPGIGAPIMKKLMADGGITAALKQAISEPPTPMPLWPSPQNPGPTIDSTFIKTPSDDPPAVLPVRRARDFWTRYSQGTLTPETVAERVLTAITDFDHGPLPLRTFIAVKADDVRAQAQASAQRWREKKPLSLLDGVPVAIKDEFDQVPYGTTGGTRFLGKTPTADDATTVRRLRAAGALLIGKTNMHEIGIQPNGLNVHHGQARNPFDRTRDPGGSSSGPAVAVAAGLCPIALGSDGGGSIRIPAALCGQVGLKATFGRISEHGALPLCWSVGHAGPITASVEDAALAYAIIAGADAHDPMSQKGPTPTLAGWSAKDLSGLRLGVFKPWYLHAEPEIVQSCDAALEKLCAAGARVVPITISQLELLRVAHSITILSEFAASTAADTVPFTSYGATTRLMLATGRAMAAKDYVWAQRARTRLMAEWKRVFSEVDVVITPATAAVAPELPATIAKDGWSNLDATVKVMRYIVAGNFLGLPSLTFPVGYNTAGLPIGMLATGRAWEEHTLLRVASAAERAVERRRPTAFVDLLA